MNPLLRLFNLKGCVEDGDSLIEWAADEITTLRQQLEQAQAESVQAVANKVCGEIPEDWAINLCMENGAAWVEAIKPSGCPIDIDGGDVSLVERIDEALRLADEAGQEGEGDE